MHFAIKYVKMQINNGYESGINIFHLIHVCNLDQFKIFVELNTVYFFLEQHVHFNLESYEYLGIM